MSAAVADRAGVSVRTVYRHFPTKADLLDATSRRYLDRVGAEGPPDSSSALLGHLRELWPVFADDIDAVRAEHSQAQGRALRALRRDSFRPTVVTAVGDEAPALSGDDRARLADLIIALASSGMFLELVDRLGRDPVDAADTVTWAVRALLAAAARNGSVSPVRPEPMPSEDRP